MRFTIKKYHRITAMTYFLLVALAPAVFAQVAGGEKVLAEGNGYIFTLKDFEAYKLVVAPENKRIDNGDLLRYFLKFDLFSREYLRNHKNLLDNQSSGDAVSIEKKINFSKRYVQEVLSEYKVSEDVVESYYLSYPEKFVVKTYDSSTSVPLNDDLKKEIKFQIVEKKKNEIIEETAKKLMERDHIKITAEKF